MTKKRHLIFIDLDSTLLTKRKKIPLKAKFYLRKLAKKGHIIIIATGRPYQGAYRFYRSLKITQYPIVVDNGGAILKPAKDYSYQIIDCQSIKKEQIIELYQECQSLLFGAMATSLNKIYVTNKDAIPFWLIHLDLGVKLIEGPLEIIIDEDLLNLSFQVNPKDQELFLKIISQQKYANLLFYKWGLLDEKTISYEISLKTATKGEALKTLAKLYNVDINQTLAFGDNENDISMLKTAYLGVAMLNSGPLVKEYAKEVTFKTNDHNGVCHYLKRLKL